MSDDLECRATVTEGHVHLWLHDPDGSLEAVRLHQEVARPRFGPEFVRFTGSDVWQLMLPRPDADRLEYLVQVTRRGGGVETLPDAGNPAVAPGPFGDKSVIEFPGYVPPSWLHHTGPAGSLLEIRVESERLDAAVAIQIWTAASATPETPLPLLLAHDGPEYALYSSLLALLDRECAEGRLPPLHVALLQPGNRDEEYTASADYAEAVVTEILPAIEAIVAVGEHPRRVGMGASLGALAMLHLHRLHPDLLDAMLLQSGSFFRPGVDDSVAWLDRHARITGFVAETLAGTRAVRAVPVRMTCGTVEENLAANRAMRDALASQGYAVGLVENRDGHNWVAWRDTFDPVLTDLLRMVCAA